MIVSRKAHLLMALLPMAVVAAAALPSSAARAQWWSRAPGLIPRHARMWRKKPRPRKHASPVSPHVIRNLPADASPAAATPISISCRTAASTSPAPIRRRKSSATSTSNIPPFLNRERQSRIASELAAKKYLQQQQEQQQLSLRSEKTATPAPPPAKPRAGSTLALAAASMPPPATSAPKPRPKAAACARPSFSASGRAFRMVSTI